jgi:hypothetical protein
VSCSGRLTSSSRLVEAVASVRRQTAEKSRSKRAAGRSMFSTGSARRRHERRAPKARNSSTDSALGRVRSLRRAVLGIAVEPFSLRVPTPGWRAIADGSRDGDTYPCSAYTQLVEGDSVRTTPEQFPGSK